MTDHVQDTVQEETQDAPTAAPNHNPRIIVVANGKGGVGKSTTSTSIAVWLAERGLRVLLIDGDEKDEDFGTAGVWAATRIQAGRPMYEIAVARIGSPVVHEPVVDETGAAMTGEDGQPLTNVRALTPDEIGTQVYQYLVAAKESGLYDAIVLDCGGRISPVLRAGALLSSLVVTPTAPNFADIWSLVGTIQNLSRVREGTVDDPNHGNFRAVIVLTRAKVNTKRPASVREHLAQYAAQGIEVSNAVIYERSVIETAMGRGAVAWEMRPKDGFRSDAIRAASADIQALMRSLFPDMAAAEAGFDEAAD